MMTLRQFAEQAKDIPAITAWYLADLSEARGKQELFTKQSPQRLKVLREHALIESAVSSNRIEDVVVEPARVNTILFGKSHLRDRDEEEVRGYRDALKLIHEQGARLPVSEKTIKQLHLLSRAGIGDALLNADAGADELWLRGPCALIPRDVDLTGLPIEAMVPGTWKDWYAPFAAPPLTREPLVSDVPLPTFEEVIPWGRVKLGHAKPTRDSGGSAAIRGAAVLSAPAG